MENIKKLIWFLNKETNNNDSIQPSWDGHRWITLIDLPSLGKFGLGASEDKMKSVEMAIDHAVLFVDEYLDKHPDIKIENDQDDLNYIVTELTDGSIVLSVSSEK